MKTRVRISMGVQGDLNIVVEEDPVTLANYIGDSYSGSILAFIDVDGEHFLAPFDKIIHVCLTKVED